jgi:hypothetical protein
MSREPGCVPESAQTHIAQLVPDKALGYPQNMAEGMEQALHRAVALRLDITQSLASQCLMPINLKKLTEFRHGRIMSAFGKIPGTKTPM